MLQSNQKIIRHKVGLLNLAEELGNVSKACQMMGLSRDTFYRYRDAVEDGGVEALLEKPRRVPNFKNRVDEETENAVVDYAVEYPAYGQVRVSNEEILNEAGLPDNIVLGHFNKVGLGPIRTVCGLYGSVQP